MNLTYGTHESGCFRFNYSENHISTVEKPADPGHGFSNAQHFSKGARRSIQNWLRWVRQLNLEYQTRGKWQVAITNLSFVMSRYLAASEHASSNRGKVNDTYGNQLTRQPHFFLVFLPMWRPFGQSEEEIQIQVTLFLSVYRLVSAGDKQTD